MHDRHAALLREHLDQVLASAGKTDPDLRALAAANADVPAELRVLVDKIHRTPWKVTDEDIATLRAAYSDDSLFEVIVAAAMGAARDRLEAGLRVLEEASS